MVAVFCGGFGGPEEGVDAAVDGDLGRFGKVDCVDAGIKGCFGIGVAERAARSVRVFEPLFPAEDFKDDAPGGMQASGWEPSRRSRRRDQRFPFRSWLGG